ncbi:hypothetical protein K2X05_05855 [bacterium]|nr:hypothetical protein [bacterium]
MKSIISFSLSLCLVLCSNPAWSAYQCNGDAIYSKQAKSYEVAHQKMNQELVAAAEDVAALPQPLEFVMDVASGETITAVRSVEAGGRAVVNSVGTLVQEAIDTGKCTLRNVKKAHLFGTVNCAIVAGGNVVLITAATVNAGVRTAQVFVTSATDVAFNASINLSQSIARTLKKNNADILAVPFIVISKVLRAGQWVVRATVGYVGDVAETVVSGVAKTICQPFSALSYLAEGDGQMFLETLVGGTLVATAETVNNTIEVAIVKPLAPVGRWLQKIGVKTKKWEQKLIEKNLHHRDVKSNN